MGGSSGGSCEVSPSFKCVLCYLGKLHKTP
jgi:hypothetical protein